MVMSDCSSFTDLLLNESPSSSTNNQQTNEDQWCDKCYKQAQGVETKYKKSIDIIKKKILFTDRLIGMYTQMKSSLEEAQSKVKTLEQECKRKETDNVLINKQLKALLSDHNPTELQMQKDETAKLKITVENLNDQVKSVEMTRKMLEDKITFLKEEITQKEVDWKKHNKEKDQLQKEVTKLKKTNVSLEKENHALTKKNQVLQERMRRRRSRGSGSFSHTTDSEHNSTAPSEDLIKEEVNEAAQNPAQSPTVFKSPLPEKKKKLKRKRRKSHAIPASDDDDGDKENGDQSLRAHLSNVSSQEKNTAEDQGLKQTVSDKNSSRDISSSSDTGNDTKSYVASNNMKSRILEMKKKRAYRSFCNHPSGTQLKELSDIVNRLKKDDSNLTDDVKSFCVKHFLTGHEKFVVRKIEKLHKDSLSPSLIDVLRDVDFTASTTATISKNSNEDDGNQDISVRLGANSDQAASEATTQSIVGKNTDAVPTLSGEKAQSTNLISNLSKDLKPVDESTSADSFPPNIASIPSLVVPDEKGRLEAVDTTSQQPKPASISMFSSDDEELQVKIQSVSHSEPSNEPVALRRPTRIRTRSLSKSLSENQKSSDEANVADGSTSSAKLSTQRRPSGGLPPISTLLSSSHIKTSSISEFSSDSLDSDFAPVLPKKVRISRVSVEIAVPKNRIGSHKTTTSVSQPRTDSDKPEVTAAVSELPKKPELTPDKNRPISDAVAESPATKRKNTASPALITKMSKLNDGATGIGDVASSKEKKQSRTKSKPNTDNAKSLKQKNQSHAKSKPNNDTSDIDDVTFLKQKKQSHTKSKPNDGNTGIDGVMSSKQKKQSHSKLKPNEDDTVINDVTSSKADMPGHKAKLDKDEMEVRVEGGHDVAESSKQKKQSHPVLASLQSLPFSVGSDDFASSSPKAGVDSSYSFLPISSAATQLSDDESSDDGDLIQPVNDDVIIQPDSNDVILQPDVGDPMIQPHDDFMSPSKLNTMLEDMTMVLSMECISPLGNADMNSTFASIELNVEDDNRLSISPSAGLCTAISFPGNTAINKPKMLSPIEEKSISSPSLNSKEFEASLKKPPLSVGDAPRRFSCEIPVLARSVPTVKRICKAQSLDPAALTSIYETTAPYLESVTATPTLNVQSETTSKIRPTNIKIATGSYTGPFKVVGPTSPPATSSDDASTICAIDNAGPNVKSPGKMMTNAVQQPTDKIKEATEEPIPPQPVALQVASREAMFHTTQQPEPIEEPSLPSASFNIKKPPLSRTCLSEMIQSIHSCATVVYPEKTFSPIPPTLVMNWLVNVIKHSHMHSMQEVLSTYLKTNRDFSSLQFTDCVTEWERQFVLMIIAVDRVRSQYQRGVIESLVVPTVMKILCKFGFSLVTSPSLFKDHDQVYNLISIMLKNGKLENGHTCSLVRILSCLSRSVAYARAVIDFCRYALTSLSVANVENMISNCIVCYPEAFSKHYPMSGKLILHTLAFQAELHAYVSKPEAFRQDIRNRARHLELLLGWSEDESVVSQTRKDWCGLIFDRCMVAVKSAKFLQSTDSPVASDVVSLSFENIEDVFLSLEFLANIKNVAFVTTEIIDRKFWPWLNAWSRHLVMFGNKEKDKPVSDACVVAVLHGLATVLLAVILKQRLRSGIQVPAKQAVGYFDTICSLLVNFTARHLKTAPKSIQCATALTIMKLSFCKPALAYNTVFDWLIASREQLAEEEFGRSKESFKSHPYLKQMIAFYPEKALRKTVSWLEHQTKFLRSRDKKFANQSLTLVLWG